MAACVEGAASGGVQDGMPQWKRDLIARLRSQNKRVNSSAPDHQQHHDQQVKEKETKADKADKAVSSGPETGAAGAMVQEGARTSVPTGNANGYGGDSDQEDLRYGPGIVHRLRDKYLSLALRETSTRPTVLRKATSLENLLDDTDSHTTHYNNDHKGGFEKNTGRDANVTLRSRYHRPRVEMKRARSVETISRLSDDSMSNQRQSLHEEVFQNGENVSEWQAPPLRPKRLQPLVAQSEKPPHDLVRQAKLVFEKKPESRTRKPALTGDVAAKVEEFNSIIVKAKVASKRPPIKHTKPNTEKTKNIINHSRPPAKPIMINETIPTRPPLTNGKNSPRNSPQLSPLPVPIPDVSRIERESPEHKINLSSETPDLILTSSPVQNVSLGQKRHSTESFLKEERKISRSGHLEPLKVEVNGYSNASSIPATLSPRLSPKLLQTARQLVERDESVKKSPPLQKEVIKMVVDETKIVKSDSTVIEIQKHVSVVHSSDNLKVVDRPKRKTNVSEESGALVFNFTSRTDVPDYIANDTSRKAAPPEVPRAGEGGVVLLTAWAAAGCADAEELEALRSLEGPPSPCDVRFINDNVLIDGRSSLAASSGKTKVRAKLKISFVESGPDVFEYPSENSLLLDESPVGHNVPNISGSSLADYIPKTSDGFELGVTRREEPDVSFKKSLENLKNGEQRVELSEAEEPVVFSSGATSDILF